ncbi:MAG TPA: LuxR C-terminal-related transcriptional regulator, partial [Conexibacter sp.]|nr:LuxR C-terminal-related transcriptional regulator [Conexibacter sp.]
AIAAALDAREPLAPGSLAALTSAAAVDRPLLRMLAGTLAARQHPFVLMLDDAHLLHGPDAAVLLELLAARIPSGSLLALGARTEPPLPLARLRTDGLLLELGAAQLALDAQEGALLLERAGMRLTSAEAATLVARTEGWPAGLVLAARVLGEANATPADFSGADGIVAAYVREQLLSGLAPAERELLLRSVPLERLSGELCDAVLQRRGSGLLLRELAHGNMPLIPLDRAERSFRLHRLVADALLADLRRTDAAWELQAHRRASVWHERRGDAERAIEHAIAAGDAPHAAALIRATLPGQALGAGRERLAQWLDMLGRERIETTPDLALAAALERLVAAHAGDAAWLASAAAAVAEGDGPVADARRRGPAIVRALLARDGVATMQADAERSLAGCTRPGWRALAALAAGVADQLAGRDAAAQERFEDGAWHAGSLALAQALCLAQLALLALDRDDAQRAVVTARQAHATLEQAQLAQAPLAAPVAAIASFAEACGGSLEQARIQLDRVCAVLPADAQLPPWLELELRYALARTRLQLADAAGARSELTRMSRALRALPDAVAARAWIEDAWARADAFAASSVRGPARLTLAELRVLRLLPSHLSLREIAGRLHVSANTVKTQAQAVYRKLDVSSRSEAVARAREVGLV